MRFLGIETSCDETSVSLVDDGLDVIGLKTFSQTDTHALFGGVVPEIASRLHAETLHTLVDTLLRETGTTPQAIDALAVTNGPGLVGALLVGVSFANALAYAWKKPVVGINHLEAHWYAAFMDPLQRPSLPALALLVSGGHTQLILIRELGKQEVLGATLDDAAGEAFDKTAKLLGLPYPGGPVVDRLAKQGNPHAFRFPQALREDKKNLNFSFSGLKTSVLYTIRDLPKPLPPETVNDLCASLQKAIVDILVYKSEQALKITGAGSLVVCGGVAANSELQAVIRKMAERVGASAHFPSLQLCTDNAAMIAGLGYHKQHLFRDTVSAVHAQMAP